MTALPPLPTVPRHRAPSRPPRRFVVASVAHLIRLFPGEEHARDRAACEAELARTGGAWVTPLRLAASFYPEFHYPAIAAALYAALQETSP